MRRLLLVDMDLLSLSTTIVLVSTVAAIILAFPVYWAYRAWMKRTMALGNSADRDESQREQKFFRLWQPPE